MLRLTDVYAGYGGGDVLQGVDLEVPERSVCCIVGPNGAGKSTVLRAVSGLLEPRVGDVQLGGKSICGLHPARILGMGVSQVPQSNALFPALTVRENVLMGAYIQRRDKKLLQKRYDAVAELFPIIRERADDRAGNLSGGQRRMVEFGRSLMLEMRAIRMDHLMEWLASWSGKDRQEGLTRTSRGGGARKKVRRRARRRVLSRT
jgi:ABC-type branched-subunit amino acid transport system ATPase component